MHRPTLAALLIVILTPLAVAQDATLKLGDVFEGSIDSVFDSDVVQFSGVAGALATITAKGAKGFHPTLTLTDLSSGDPLDLTDFLVGVGGTKAIIKKFPLPTTGEYEVSIATADETVGGYKLTTKGVVTKKLKNFKDGTPTAAGTGQIAFAAVAGAKLSSTIKPIKGATAVPGVPLLDGPDGPIDLTPATTLTTGKKPKAKVTAFELPTLGDYTLTAVEQGTDGDPPPFVITVKLAFPKVKKTTYVETSTFGDTDTELVSLASSGQQAAAGSLDSVITFDGSMIAFLSHATNLVPGCGGGVSPDPPVYDVFVRDRDAQTTVAASVASGETEDGVGGCESPTIDSLGTLVAFSTAAAGLVAGDGNNAKDIFVRDLGTLTTTRVSVTTAGDEADGDSTDPSLSGEGLMLAFASTATDLVTGDANGTSDIFLRDLVNNTTTRISVTAAGDEGHGISIEPSFSRDGTRVAFTSTAADLVSGDGNAKQDVFVKVLASGEVLRASLTDSGQEIASDANGPALSGDGRFVAFVSAGHFATADDNSFTDVFVKDLVTGQVDLVSVTSGGAQGNNNAVLPKISANGQLVLFRSLAGNLVPGGDPNGPTNGDTFLRDRGAATTIKVSVSYLGEPGDGDSYPGDISGDGSHATFFGSSINLVQVVDQNGEFDVWVRF